MDQVTRRHFMATTAAGAASVPLSQASAAEVERTARTTLDSAVSADGKVLDRAALEAFLKSIEKEKQKDLIDAGLSPTFLDDVNGPWEMLNARIARFVAGGDLTTLPTEGDKFSRSVQVVTVPSSATWDDPKYGPFRLCKVLADSMPKWQPTYDVSGGNSFGDAYGMFIQSLSVPAPTEGQQKEIDTARTNWQAKLGEVRKREAGVGKRWLDFDAQQQGVPPGRRITFDQYVSRYETPVLSSMYRALSGYQQVLTKKINDYTKGYGLVADIIARYSAASAMFQTPGEGTGDDIPQNVYRYSVDQKLEDFKKRAAGQPSGSISWEFNSSSFRLSSSSSYWGGSASYGFFARGSAGGSSSHIDWHSNDFHLLFKAKAIEKFVIVPGDWYSGPLIKLYKQGPFVPGSVADNAYRGNILWGKDGILALRASALILVYEPSVELSISKQDYERNASQWSASGGLNIGCFSFGASAGGSKEDVKYDAANSKISATDTTGVPKIIAVVNDVFPELS